MATLLAELTLLKKKLQEADTRQREADQKIERLESGRLELGEVSTAVAQVKAGLFPSAKTELAKACTSLHRALGMETVKTSPKERLKAKERMNSAAMKGRGSRPPCPRGGVLNKTADFECCASEGGPYDCAKCDTEGGALPCSRLVGGNLNTEWMRHQGNREIRKFWGTSEGRKPTRNNQLGLYREWRHRCRDDLMGGMFLSGQRGATLSGFGCGSFDGLVTKDLYNGIAFKGCQKGKKQKVCPVVRQSGRDLKGECDCGGHGWEATLGRHAPASLSHPMVRGKVERNGIGGVFSGEVQILKMPFNYERNFYDWAQRVKEFQHCKRGWESGTFGNGRGTFKNPTAKWQAGRKKVNRLRAEMRKLKTGSKEHTAAKKEFDEKRGHFERSQQSWCLEFLSMDNTGGGYCREAKNKDNLHLHWSNRSTSNHEMELRCATPCLGARDWKGRKCKLATRNGFHLFQKQMVAKVSNAELTTGWIGLKRLVPHRRPRDGATVFDVMKAVHAPTLTIVTLKD